MSVRVTHNVNARRVVDLMREETAAWATDIAEALAGAEVDGKVVGIVGVLANAGKSPPPSKPGKPPNWRTGSLARSWRTRAARSTDKQIMAVAGTNTLYARFLEYGTRRGLAPRPFMAAGVASVKGYAAKRKAEVGPRVRRRLSGGSG